jgi:hypothetical protein
MQQLESLLTGHETAVEVDFDALKHCIRCYAHIINICLSHVIASVTSVSKLYLSALKVPFNSNRVFCDDSEDELDDNNIDPNRDVDDLELDGCYNGHGNPELIEWFAGLKHDPLKRARRVIRLLRSLDQHREGLCEFIKLGNEQKWFFEKTQSGKISVKVPELQLLRDVKTRWDSVYKMLERLRHLRPVSLSQALSDSALIENLM